MTWIVIVVAVMLAAFGPIMWLRPSAKDRRLAAIRQRAREEGLSVEIVNIEKPFSTPEERVSRSGIIRPATRMYVIYKYPLDKRLHLTPCWRLVKVPGQVHGPIPGWRPESRIIEPSGKFWERVASAVSRLPEDAEIFELTQRFVSCYWQEAKGADSATVSALAQVLRAFAQDMEMLEAKLSREIDDQDGA